MVERDDPGVVEQLPRLRPWHWRFHEAEQRRTPGGGRLRQPFAVAQYFRRLFIRLHRPPRVEMLNVQYCCAWPSLAELNLAQLFACKLEWAGA